MHVNPFVNVGTAVPTWTNTPTVTTSGTSPATYYSASTLTSGQT